MKKIYEVWLPRANEPTILIRFVNDRRKYQWNSGNKMLKNLHNGKQVGPKRFSDVFTKSERKFIKSKLKAPQNYENALKSIIDDKNFSVVRKNKNVHLSYKPNTMRQTYVKTTINNPFTLNITSGKTRYNLRNKGIGKQMRALMTLAAKKTGFKNVTQTSIFNEPEMRNTHTKPPSSYVMQSLGFKQKPNKRFVNVYHHKYTFKNKNNSRLMRAAYPSIAQMLKRSRLYILRRIHNRNKNTIQFKNTNNTIYHLNIQNKILKNANGKVLQTGVRLKDLFSKERIKYIYSLMYPKPINSPSVRTRRQQGGTCWFHAIINGLLMSPKARSILARRIPPINTKVGDVSIFSNHNSCPSKSASGELFWSYIAHRIGKIGVVNVHYKNKNVIRNIGLRATKTKFLAMIPRLTNTKRTYMKRLLSSRSSVMGGIVTDMYHVYDKLFPGDWSKIGENKPTTFVVKKGKEFDKHIKHAGADYDLSHCYITCHGVAHGHAITGYVSSDLYIYDSSFDKRKKIDWNLKSSDKEIKEQIIKKDHKFSVIRLIKYATYVKIP